MTQVQLEKNFLNSIPTRLKEYVISYMIDM